MSNYYCSDPHAFHNNIIKHARRLAFLDEAERAEFLELEARGQAHSYRVGDEATARMNQALVDGINARVRPGDVLWCLGDWAFGRGEAYFRNARWFRDQIQCRTVNLIWGNHDERRIRDLFAATYDQVKIHDHGATLILNHYPMLTWDGQHHGSPSAPNVHLYGHVHARYQIDESTCPVRDPSAWAALDVGFDGHDYQVWSIDEVLDWLRPRLVAFDRLKRESGRFDPFRGRGIPAPVRDRA